MSSAERPGPDPTSAIWAANAGSRGPTDAHVVLVHGSLDRSAGLLKLSRRLDDRSVVTRYDRRGYGRSRPHDGPFDMAGHVADLIDVITSSKPPGAQPTVVIGHSYGGNVALAAADRQPGLIDAIVTYETPLSWLPWWHGQAGSDALAWRHDPEQAAERFMRRLIGDDRWERLPPASRAARRAEGFAMIGELTDLAATAPWRAERIDVPVLCLCGEHGTSQHRRGTEELASMLPSARMVTVDGARHFGPNTHAGVVAELVVDHIARLSRSRS